MRVKRWPNGMGEDRLTKTGTWEIFYPYGSNPYWARFFPRQDPSYAALVGGKGSTPQEAMERAQPPRSMRWES
jgi:hypothetical protein